MLLRGVRVARRHSTRHFTSASSSSSNRPPPPKISWSDDWKIPSIVGFGVLAVIQWKHLNTAPNLGSSRIEKTTDDDDDDDARAGSAFLRSLVPSEKTFVELNMATERQMQALEMFPYRLVSRFWGWINHWPLYVFELALWSFFF